MREVRKGDLVEVVDATPLGGKRKLPFAKGARFKVSEVSHVGLRLQGVGGYWKPSRFEVRRG